MKRLIILLSLSLTGALGFAQTNKTISGEPMDTRPVPSNVTTEFSKTYPKATGAEWKNMGTTHSVVFRNDQTNLEEILIYDNNGTVIRQEQQLDITKVPTGIVNYYNTNYPNSKDYIIWSSRDNTGSMNNPGTLTYYSTYNGQLMYFDGKGNLVRSEKVNNPSSTAAPSMVTPNTTSPSAPAPKTKPKN